MKPAPDADFLARLREVPDPVAPRVQAAARSPAHPRAPGRRLARQQRVLALAVSLAWLGIHLVIFGVRGDLATLPPVYLQAQVLVPLGLAAASLAVALAGGRLGLGLSVGLVSVLALLGPAAFCLLGAGAPVPHGPPAGAGSLVSAFVCLDITVAWALVPLLLAALTLRGSFPAAARWRGALLGAAAGLFAGATMNLHCANVAPFHMLIGHGVPVLAATVLGALVVSRWTRA